MPSGPSRDLALSRTAKRVTAGLTVGVLGVLAMTMVVFADYNHWTGALLLAAALAVGFYFFGTQAYRVQPRAPGRIQLNTMLGNHQVDLRNGFTVKEGLLGARIVVLKVGRKRYRLNGALGGSVAITKWLEAVRSAGEHDVR